jgi:hypothetical protein
MNVIQMMMRTDFYNDRYKSPRFPDSNYMDAFNASINMLFKDKTDNKKMFRKYSFQSNEQVRRELYTLIKTATIVPTGDVVIYPADFYYFGEMTTTVNGITNYCRPTNFNEIGPLLDNPFRRPTAGKTYYIENSTGLRVYYGGTTGFTSSSLTYLKTPNTVSIGMEDDKINPGGAALVNGTVYMVYADAVQNGNTYYTGETFTAVGTALTSGVVIPNSVIVNCDLPDNVHDEICKVASELMNGTIEDYNKSAFLQQEIEKQ